ncbi:MAG: helix-turn-helix transcriptional regulator [Bacteroidales bacterium]|nr:helix-turn-helix transcriptional regulator [Bacteroidales bacterium]
MKKDQVLDPLFPECPVRNVLSRIGEKWYVLVLLTLDGTGQPMRFKTIEAAIPDISQKMLTQTLRDLEADGLVLRHAYAEVPPRVEYELTDRSRSLLPYIHSLVGWALDNLSDIVRDRKAFSEKG